MNVLVRHTGRRGRPPVCVMVKGRPVGIVAARLYQLLENDPSACWSNNYLLAEKVGFGSRAVVRALNTLETAGLIERHFDKLARHIKVIS